MTKAPVTAIIVGAGHRALAYAAYAKQAPDKLQIVGVADPNTHRRQEAAAAYNVPPERCFHSAEELAALPQMADAVINGTMDTYHVPTSIPLLQAGYHILLEKPLAVNEEEMWQLVEANRQYQKTIMICHVLRYAPFYSLIRERIVADEIGEILSLETTEHVSYHHMAVAFIRGKWGNEKACGSPMLMAKCCHDLDLLAWMKSGIAPRRVSSLGDLSYFTPARAPQGAGTRCLVDCPIESECLYSARKHYLDHPQRWSAYVWEELQEIAAPTVEQKTELLKTSAYGKCVWKSDNDVVDHQAVIVEFADGSHATHNMVGGSARSSRSIHIIGTKGEISGCLEEQNFVVRKIDPRPGHEYSEETVDVASLASTGGHGGGDLRLIADFCQVIQGRTPSLSYTSLDDSIAGHLIGFRADVARRNLTVEELHTFEEALQ